MTDPIADMLTRIRNASMVRKADVLVPFSKIKLEVAKILQQEKYITKVEVIEEKFKTIKISLRYEGKKSAITRLARVSKIGRRTYAKKDEIPRVLNNYGISILSTSKGIMTNKSARKVGVGGEIICEVY
jgi:small subunit ribosomal protein S8